MNHSTFSSRLARTVLAACALSLVAGGASVALAQSVDSARVGIAPQTDSTRTVPARLRSASDSIMDHRDSVLLQGSADPSKDCTPALAPRAGMGTGLARPRHRRRDVLRARGWIDRDADLREERAPSREACRAGQLLRRRLDARASARDRGTRARAKAASGRLGSAHLLHPSLLRRRRLRLGASLGRARAGARRDRRCAARTLPRRSPFERERRARSASSIRESAASRSYARSNASCHTSASFISATPRACRTARKVPRRCSATAARSPTGSSAKE